MHELSIAENIVEIIHQHVEKDRLIDVRSVRVKVGAYSGVVADSLEFSFQAITAATELEESFLVLEKIPFIVECKECGKKSENDDGITQCPMCGSFETKIVSGRELQVIDIELEDIEQEVV